MEPLEYSISEVYEILELHKHDIGQIDIVSIDGVTIMSIDYTDVNLTAGEDYLDIVVYAMSEDSVKLKYNAIKRVRIWPDCIEITV